MRNYSCPEGAFGRTGYMHKNIHLSANTYMLSPNIALTIKQENLKAGVSRKVGLMLGIEGKEILRQIKGKDIPDMSNKDRNIEKNSR